MTKQEEAATSQRFYRVAAGTASEVDDKDKKEECSR